MPTIIVQGMHCGNCEKAVTEAMAKVSGVTSITVDSKKGCASWVDTDEAHPVSPEVVKEAIRTIGFDAP